MKLLKQCLPIWIREVAGAVVYIQNISPHAILRENTPEEVFTKKKPAVDHMRIFGTPDHMRIFGTPVYIHVSKEKRAKLEPSCKKGIFVAYSDCSKVY